MSPAASDARPRLTVISPGPLQGRAYELHDGTQTIGRGAPADLVVPLPYVSGRHAFVRWDSSAGTTTILDAGSTNGTIVNDEPVDGGRGRELRSGDVVALGDVRLRVDVPRGRAEPGPAHAGGIHNVFDAPSSGDFYQAERDINIRSRHDHRYEVPDPMQELFDGRGTGRGLMAVGLLLAVVSFAVWIILIFASFGVHDATAPMPLEAKVLGLPIALLAFGGFAAGGLTASLGHGMSRAARARERSHPAHRAAWW